MGSLILFSTACNSYVERSKYEELQRQLEKAKAELGESKRQLEEAKKQITEVSGQKFSTYRDGSRTWRFNSATGETCILLAAEWDWKNKKTKMQSCDCQDTRASYWKALQDANAGEDRKLGIDGWGPWVKESCGG